MSEVTVKQLAEAVGIPVDRLLVQLGEAGVGVPANAEATISDSDKMQLLKHLRQANEATEAGAATSKKITLKRKTVSELKQGSAGKSKTVSVEVRKRRTYVKRNVVADEEPVEQADQAEAVEQVETAEVEMVEEAPVVVETAEQEQERLAAEEVLRVKAEEEQRKAAAEAAVAAAVAAAHSEVQVAAKKAIDEAQKAAAAMPATPAEKAPAAEAGKKDAPKGRLRAAKPAACFCWQIWST